MIFNLTVFCIFLDFLLFLVKVGKLKKSPNSLNYLYLWPLLRPKFCLQHHFIKIHFDLHMNADKNLIMNHNKCQQHQVNN